MNENIFASSVHHVVLSAHADFGRLCAALEGRLGRFAATSVKPGMALKELEKNLAELARGEDFLIFDVYDHGHLLTMSGGAQPAKVFVIGNPLLALSMTKHDVRAALYAPLRVLIFEAGPGRCQVEYDLPSTLLAPFKNAEVSRAAAGLDAKLKALLARVAAAV